MRAPRITQVNIPEGMIDLSIGQPSLSLLPLESLRTAAEHCLSQGNPELLQYGADQGDGFFRVALAEFLGRRYAEPVDPDSLFVTTGASQALDLICTRFTKPGDTIFVEEPTYFLALLVFRDHGLNVVGIPTDENGMRMDSLEHALSRHRPALVYTIPAFQNPSGVTLSPDRREALMTLSHQHEFLVVADEVYHALDFGSAPSNPLATQRNNERVLSLGSFSKICAPGLRLGWVQTAPALVDQLTSSGLLESGGGLNPFTSKIMQSMLETGLEDACLDRLRGVYAERSAIMSAALRDHLPAARFTQPAGGFFIWLQLPEGRPAGDMLADAERYGVGFQPGTRFANGGAFTHHVRLSFAHYEPAKLVEGVERLARVVG